MKLTRRTFLVSSAAAGAISLLPPVPVDRPSAPRVITEGFLKLDPDTGALFTPAGERVVLKVARRGGTALRFLDTLDSEPLFIYAEPV